MTDFLAIEVELLKRREQAESVRGKDTPFRVEFRYSGGTKHYQYFTDQESAACAEDSVLSYLPSGGVRVERSRSKRVQERGPRGGWSR